MINNREVICANKTGFFSGPKMLGIRSSYTGWAVGHVQCSLKVSMDSKELFHHSISIHVWRKFLSLLMRIREVCLHGQT